MIKKCRRLDVPPEKVLQLASDRHRRSRFQPEIIEWVVIRHVVDIKPRLGSNALCEPVTQMQFLHPTLLRLRHRGPALGGVVQTCNTTVQIHIAATQSLELATGRLRYGPGRDQHNDGQLDLEYVRPV